MDERVKINIMNSNLNLIRKFGDNISKNINLSNYNWFNLGGPAEYFFKPKNINQLIEFFEENKKNKLKITIIGAGSNTLVRDNGIKGVVIKLGASFSSINLFNENIIEVGAATLDRKIANFAKDNELSGLEFLSCIPGSIGGAVVMNSGCYGDDISKILVSITVIDINNCTIKEIKSEDIKFVYRSANLPKNFIIISVKLKGKKTIKDIIEKKQNYLIKKKKLSQPSQVKTCGSTFKNLSEEKKAWKFIKKSGCENFSVGDAIISNKHCNFFVNNGNAKSSDIEKLIKKVKHAVKHKMGINLELEIKIIGE